MIFKRRIFCSSIDDYLVPKNVLCAIMLSLGILTDHHNNSATCQANRSTSPEWFKIFHKSLQTSIYLFSQFTTHTFYSYLFEEYFYSPSEGSHYFGISEQANRPTFSDVWSGFRMKSSCSCEVYSAVCVCALSTFLLGTRIDHNMHVKHLVEIVHSLLTTLFNPLQVPLQYLSWYLIVCLSRHMLIQIKFLINSSFINHK